MERVIAVDRVENVLSVFGSFDQNLRLLEEDAPWFSLKLCYSGEKLIFAALDGRPLAL